MVYIRPLQPADEAHLAFVLPDEPLPEARAITLIACGDQNRLLGWGTACTALHGNPLQPGRLFLHVAVTPADRGEGVGRSLGAALVDAARAAGAATLATAAPADSVAALAMAARLGFRPDYQMREAELELPGYDLTPWLAGLEGARSGGIRFASMADERDPLAAARELWELDHRLSADVPEWSGEVVPFEQYRESMLGGAGYDPSAVFLARDGQRAVGMAGSSVEENSAYTWFLGVDRAYRGRGIAMALKVLTIGWAMGCGLERLKTHNNAASAAIVGLNEKLGYRVTGATQYLLRGIQEADSL